MASASDLWSYSWVKPIKKPVLIVGPLPPARRPNVQYSKHDCESSRGTKNKRLTQFRNSKTMVIYSRKRNCSNRFGHYKFQPMTLSKDGYQDFALLTECQVLKLEHFFIENGSMTPQDYRMELEDLVCESGSEIVSYPLLECGHSYCGNVVHNFIIVCIDYECDPEDFGASRFGFGTWIKFLDKNVNDIDVPGCNKDPSGVVVARFSTFPKTSNLEMKSIKLVEEVYHSPGLQRGRTTHEGRFFHVWCASEFYVKWKYDSS